MNFFKKILCPIIIVMLMGCLPVSAISTSADASIAIDALTGEVICEKNAHTRLGIASTTKIMTAILALEYGNLDEIVTVDPRAVGVEGSSLYLKEGEQITLGELVTVMIVKSANDGAAAVALHIAPSIEEFSEMMNNKAKELGLENTHFTNPHGLHEENHYSSAYDLAQITRYGFTLPGFAELVSTTDHKVEANIHFKGQTLINNNKLLHMYEGADGVKTGYTPETGRTLVGSATRDGMRIITVTLNDRDDWNDHIAMFNYGFENFRSYLLAEKGHSYGFMKVKNGKAKEVAIVAAENFSVLLSANSSATPRVSIFEKQIKAPVKQGKVLGKVQFYEGDNVIGSVDLVAAEDVAKAKKPNIFWRIINWIMGK